MCFIGFYPELFLIISILLITSFLVIYEFLHKNNSISQLSGKLCLFILLLILLLLDNNTELNIIIFNYFLFSNYFLNLIKLFIILFLITYITVSFDYIKLEQFNKYEYYLVLMLITLSLFTIVSSNDLIILYLAIELQSLSFYILTSIKTFSNYSTEAALKYFILGAFSSGLLLFGFSFIYGFTGTTNFSDFKLLFNNLYSSDYSLDLILLLGIILVSVSLLFKLGVAPFHMWLPDVYEGAPFIITMFFAIIPKLILFCLLFNVFFAISFYFIYSLKQMFIICSLISLIVGALGALYQVKIKRLLAYSAINNTGFMLLSFSLFTYYSMFSTFFYILTYMIISINLFLIFIHLRNKLDNVKIKKINELVLLSKSNIYISFILLVTLFSIAGIPPLLGFFSKFFVLISLLEVKMYFITFVVGFISVISAFYYIRLIKLLFFKKFKFWVLSFEFKFFESIIISTTFLVNILFYVNPSLFVLFAQNMFLYILI